MDAALARAVAAGADLCSEAVAAALDAADGLAPMRARFLMPAGAAAPLHRPAGAACVYLCGNSLGLQPAGARAAVDAEMDKWAAQAVEGHFLPERPWMTIEDTVTAGAAALVGALESEVAVMGSLTANLHMLMAAFFRPQGARTRILIEDHAFPSDTYAVKSQLAMHGLDWREHLVCVRPRDGEATLRDEDILTAIASAGSTLALVLFTGVQYYTGQAFDIRGITAAAHAVGACVGIDLAHAVGNVPLALHDDGVDFAAWCSYKYLNSGPGGIAGLFVHAKYAHETMATRPHYAGWWGHDRATRFAMGPDFVPIPGAARFQLSNPPVLQVATLRASLEVFAAAGGVAALRAKSEALTGYLAELIKREFSEQVSIITPLEAHRRGCQLSLQFNRPVREVHALLAREGIVADVREPNVIRVAPVPLYNTAADVLEFVVTLKMIFAELT